MNVTDADAFDRMRKARTTNAQWVEAAANIRQYISLCRVEGKMQDAERRIREFSAGKRVGLGWSGGKESMILQYIMEQIGIHEFCHVSCRLEIPKYQAFLRENLPSGTTVIMRPHDLDWVAARPQWLFPVDPRLHAAWMKEIQWNGEAEYYRRRNLDAIILGRRILDSNSMGPVAGAYSYTNKAGMTTFNPLRDWTNLEVLGAVHYYELPVHVRYSDPRGYLVGQEPWPSTSRLNSIADNWREVYDLGPSCVFAAAAYFPSAKAFLNGRRTA